MCLNFSDLHICHYLNIISFCHSSKSLYIFLGTSADHVIKFLTEVLREINGWLKFMPTEALACENVELQASEKIPPPYNDVIVVFAGFQYHC